MKFVNIYLFLRIMSHVLFPKKKTTQLKTKLKCTVKQCKIKIVCQIVWIVTEHHNFLV